MGRNGQRALQLILARCAASKRCAQTFPREFTPDGKHLLTAGGDDGAVRFWDVATGKETRALTRQGRVRSGGGRLAVSPDGRWLASAGNTYLSGVGSEVGLWDLTANGPPRVVTLPDGVAWALAFGPDGAVYTVEQAIEREAAATLAEAAEDVSD